MTETIPTAVQCATARAIVHTLLYFEIFSYPLTAEEVFRFSNCPGADVDEVRDKLKGLVTAGLVFEFGHFFQTQKNPAWEACRLECNERAERLLPIARRMARFIGGFPFIRGVFVSGSLSKHCMNADSDIDFFLITEPGRLWLARTLLVFFKKIFLLNSHKYFCVNYFVDTEHLEIQEKNQFTATEIVTLLPMYGREWYTAFCAANDWAWEQYPNSSRRTLEDVPQHSRPFLKKIFEWILSGRMGDWLDVKAMHLTVAFWRKKFGHLDQNTFNTALKSRRYVSKHHPLHFQEKVLSALERRMMEMKQWL